MREVGGGVTISWTGDPVGLSPATDRNDLCLRSRVRGWSLAPPSRAERVATR
jgi:hypothetical protein